MRFSKRTFSYTLCLFVSLISITVGQLKINGELQEGIDFKLSTISIVQPLANNVSLLNQNQSSTVNKSANGSEILDLLQAPANVTEMRAEVHHVIERKDRFDTEDSFKQDTEDIQTGQNEDSRVGLEDKTNNDDFREGEVAAVVAGIFVILSVVGYFGLVAWRRYLERRYGNREMLVNQEDLPEPTGLQHFSI